MTSVNGSSLSINGLAIGAIPLANALFFAPDNIYDIGTPAASRPRSAYVGTNATVGNQLTVAGGSGFGVAPSATAYVNLAAGVAGASTMRINQGVAPTSPVDGDMWREDNTNTGLKIRINGVTKTVTVG